MKRPLSAAETSLISESVTKPLLAATIERAMDKVYESAKAGVYGTTVEISDMATATQAATFFKRLGYAVNYNAGAITIFWTVLRS